LASPPPDDKHECAWQAYAKALADELATTQQQIDALKEQYEELRRKVYGKSSEKMPPMDREVRRDKPAALEQRQRARRANAERNRPAPDVLEGSPARGRMRG
jgi:uncharacterized membrane-anchored protein YhcB (DUF1043 family)